MHRNKKINQEHFTKTVLDNHRTDIHACIIAITYSRDKTCMRPSGNKQRVLSRHHKKYKKTEMYGRLSKKIAPHSPPSDTRRHSHMTDGKVELYNAATNICLVAILKTVKGCRM